MIENILVFGHEQVVIEAGVRDQDAVKWIVCPRLLHGYAHNRVKRLWANRQPDPFCEIAQNILGIDRNPLNFVEIL